MSLFWHKVFHTDRVDVLNQLLVNGGNWGGKMYLTVISSSAAEYEN